MQEDRKGDGLLSPQPQLASPSMAKCRVLLISGSLRDGSTNTAVLRTAAAVTPDDVTAVLYRALASLPHFNPDDEVEPLATSVRGLRTAIAAADAVLFSTPEYAGALPGSFKNLLDWTVGGGEIYEKPVAWVNPSTALNAAADAHASLRIVLRYAGARIVDAACANIPVVRRAVGSDGLVAEAGVRDKLTDVLTVLARAAHEEPRP